MSSKNATSIVKQLKHSNSNYDQWTISDILSGEILLMRPRELHTIPLSSRTTNTQDNPHKARENMRSHRSTQKWWIYRHSDSSTKSIRDQSKRRLWSTWEKTRILSRSSDREFLYTRARSSTSSRYTRWWKNQRRKISHPRYGFESMRQNDTARRIFSTEFYHREWTHSRTDPSTLTESGSHGKSQYRSHSLSRAILCSWMRSIRPHTPRCTL